MTRIKLSKSAPLQASLNTVSRGHIAEDVIEKQSAENTKSQLIETKSDSIVLNTQDSTDKTDKEIFNKGGQAALITLRSCSQSHK